jgi:hypothetical protein
VKLVLKQYTIINYSPQTGWTWKFFFQSHWHRRFPWWRLVLHYWVINMDLFFINFYTESVSWIISLSTAGVMGGITYKVCTHTKFKVNFHFAIQLKLLYLTMWKCQSTASKQALHLLKIPLDTWQLLSWNNGNLSLKIYLLFFYLEWTALHSLFFSYFPK